MATWTGECYLGSDSGFQTVEVQSNTHHGAKQQMKRIYGATQIRNVREVGDNDGGGFELGGSFGLWIIGGIAFIFALPYLIPIAVFGLIGWGGYKLIKWILK